MPLSKLTATGLSLVALIATAAASNAANDPVYYSRSAWGAKPPVMEMERHVPKRLTVHHTATRAKPDRILPDKLKGLQAFSQKDSLLADGSAKRAWADIPYHFYIDVGGSIGEGRAIDFVGDTNTDYNPAGHIGIAVEGNFENEKPTEAQLQSLENLLVSLSRRYRISPENISSHQDFATTACPGKHLLALMPEIRRSVAQRLQARLY